MPRTLPRLLLAIVALVLTFFLVSAALVWWRQERIVFQPPRGPWPTGDGARRIDYAAEDGQPLFAYVVGEPGPGRPLLLAFHGNADLAGWWVPWAREVNRRTGYPVMLAEYRGYAGLPGTPTYEGSAHDAEAAWRAAATQFGARREDAVLFGHSLGSAIATELAWTLSAGSSGARALLLQSPFTSARAMARIVIARPLVTLWGLISRVHFDTEGKVARLTAPVHVAHGDRDLLIPVRMGRAVHAAAQVKGELLVVPGAGHNDVDDVGGDAYWAWLERAIGVVGAPAGPGAGQPAAAPRP